MAHVVEGDKVAAKKGEELYLEIFAENGGTGVVTRTHREFGGVVATVQFPGGYKTTFFAAGLRRVRESRDT